MRNLIFWLVYGYYLLLLKTVRIKKIGFAELEADLLQNKNPVFACPHNSLLAAALCYDGSPAVFLASLSKDGELIARILEKRKYKMVRGSSSRQGVQALQQMLSYAKEGCAIGLTFDGPRGPAYVPKRGVALVAQAVHGDCYFAYAIPLGGRFLGFPKCLKLNTWDKFLLPLPFSSIAFIVENIDKNIAENKQKYQDGREADILSWIEKRCKDIYLS